MGKLHAKSLDAKTKTSGRHSDGDGLYLRTTGADKGHRAYWQYRYTFDGRMREMSLGPYPELSLADARAKHAGARKSRLVDKVDPMGDRDIRIAARIAAKAAAKAATVPTFGQCAADYIRDHEQSWREGTRRHWVETLAKHAASITDKPVDQVDANDVRQVLSKFWNTNPVTAMATRGRIECVLASAQVRGFIEANKPNPARWKGWLEQMLPSPKKVKPTIPRHAMPYNELPAFMVRLGAEGLSYGHRANQTKALGTDAATNALLFAIFTAVRSSEALNATWDEIDFDKLTWTIPASRMKVHREHVVPLSDAAVAILRTQEAAASSPQKSWRTPRGQSVYVFPGTRPGKPNSHATLRYRMRQLRVNEWMVHGMRSAARSWMAD
jgi:integrase